MTQAVCFSCGDLKVGAFTVCSSCGIRPKTDEDMVLSLAMTDHYFDISTLKRMSEMVQRGERVELDESTREKLLNGLVEFKNAPSVLSLRNVGPAIVRVMLVIVIVGVVVGWLALR
jgi:hypothetical protein